MVKSPPPGSRGLQRRGAFNSWVGKVPGGGVAAQPSVLTTQYSRAMYVCVYVYVCVCMRIQRNTIQPQKNGNLPFACGWTWGIILSEVALEKDKYCMVSLVL